MQMEGPIGQFYSGVRALDGSAIFDALPQIQPQQLERLCQAWLAGELGPIDPTNMLVAGDQADQFLELPGHAVIIYDAALEQLARHPELASDDTDFVGASLNLLGILDGMGARDKMPSVARRAAKMPIRQDDYKVRLAYFLYRGGDFEDAHHFFSEGMRSDPREIAEKSGIPLDDLLEMGRSIAASAKVKKRKTKLPPEIRDATQLTSDLFISAVTAQPLWDASAFFDAHEDTYITSPDTARLYEAASPAWDRATKARDAGNSETAIRELREVLRVFPGFVECHGLLATCWLESNRPAEALRVVDHALNTLDADYPEFHLIRAHALAALGNGDEAVLEWIKEMCIVGATPDVMKSTLRACLGVLPKTNDRAAYRQRRDVLEVALGCCGRLVDRDGDDNLLRLFASLYSRYELTGPMSPDHIAKLTGMEWERARGIYRSHA